MVIGPYALAQASTPGGLQPGEVRVRVDFEIKVSWNPPANPDPFADRATAGGAGMMRVSGAFAARLSALGQGDRTLTGYRLLGDGLIGQLESSEDFQRTDIFGEGGWVSWPLGKDENWQAKGISLGLPSFDSR